jgi:dethiobiotin synthetase
VGKGESVLKIVFVAGTGTEVGKTYVAKGLARTMRKTGVPIGVYKPVASGCIPAAQLIQKTQWTPDDSTLDADDLVSEDAIQLWEAAGKPLQINLVCPQRFEAAVAPDEAARREGKTVNAGLLASGTDVWREYCDTLIVEGAGGLFSPLTDHVLNVDLYRQFENAQLLLVAANRLGVIHDVIATCRAAAQMGVAVDRLYLSDAAPQGDPSSKTNAQQIQQWCPEIDVQEVAWGGPVSGLAAT